jgi:hypothetical protein
VTSEPVLAQLQLDQQFELEVNASGFAFGAILIQRGKDSKKHPITFYSATVLRLVGRSVRRARDGVILKSTTNRGGLL